MDSPQEPILAHALVMSRYAPPVELNYQDKYIADWQNAKINCNYDKLEINGDDCIKLYYNEVIKPSLVGHRHRKVLSVFGDDFAYSTAEIAYKYLDKFMKIVSERSKRVLGFQVDIHYSTVNEYFDTVKKIKNISFPHYKSNFVPYLELTSGRFDHWTGFYSTRIVVKKLIRDMFQDLRAIKVLYSIVTKHIHDKLDFISGFIEFKNIEIKMIEESASILLHHDAITCTSPVATINDYRKMISNTNSKINEVYSDIIKYTNSYTNSSSNHIIELLNPTGYSRTEVVNVTVNSQYIKILPNKNYKINKTQILIKFEYDEFTGFVNENSKEYYLYFEINLPSFSFTKVYFTEFPFKSDCKDECVEVSNIKSSNIIKEMVISNGFYKVELDSNEVISRIYLKESNSYISIPTGVYSYPGRKWETFSGIYIFSPAEEASHHDVQIIQSHVQVGSLLSVIETIYSISGTRTFLVHQLILYNSSDKIINQGIRSSYSIRSYDIREFAIRTKLSEFSKYSTEIFIDNSMGLAKQDYYSFENAKRLGLTSLEHNYTYIGLNSYPTVNGAMFKENEKYFGFSASNSILLNAIKRNEFEIIISRSSEHYDEKAIIDPLIDDDINVYDQFLFIANNVHSYESSRMKFNQILNNKIKTTLIRNKSEIQSNIYSLFNLDQISENVGDVDLVDINIIDNNSIMLKLKNTRSYPVLIKSSFFKNAKVTDFYQLYKKDKAYQYKLDKSAIKPLLDYKSDYEDTCKLDEGFHSHMYSYSGATFVIPEYKLIVIQIPIPPEVSS